MTPTDFTFKRKDNKLPEQSGARAHLFDSTPAGAEGLAASAASSDRIAALIKTWHFCVARFGAHGADPSEFDHDIWPRDLLMLLLVERPGLFDTAMLERLAAIDQRYYAIAHRYPPGHAPGTVAPRPDDLGAGRWWASSMPMPRMLPEGEDNDYDAMRSLALALATLFAPYGARLAAAADGDRDVYVDFLMEWISPARIRQGYESVVLAGSAFLRERSRELGFQLDAARIGIASHADFGLVLMVLLHDKASQCRFEAPLVANTDGTLRWLWPVATDQA